MINPGIGLRILAEYLTLSSNGKHLLKKSVKKSRQINKVLDRPVSLELPKILYFIKAFKVCDQVFHRQVTDRLSGALGRNKQTLYARFVAYGWISLLTWTKLLEAFNFSVDKVAQERCVLLAFRHREWNDLFDNQGYSFKQLMEIFDDQVTIPKPLTLLRQLVQSLEKIAPPDHFAKYYQQMQEVNTCSFFEHTPEKAEKILDQIAPFVALLYIRVMVPEAPAGLKEVLKPVGRWFYMLDELADLAQDKRANRITYMAMVNDPEEAIRVQYEKCRQAVLEHAVQADNLIKFLEAMTAMIINVRRQGIDIESFFDLD